eukprot:GFYU01011929.1.p1 GENE.GFYU01011929.1~~GFYU01011929.1.p1  ORF type:complete len:164 (+),score=38.18 GFYU01011929.1:136-627(+)
MSGDEGSPSLEAVETEESRIAAWVKNNAAQELSRIKGRGGNAILLPVNNTSILVEDEKTINRIEVDNSFNFDQVTEIMLSDELECPLKPNYFYVTVLCFTGKPIPLMLPYMYEKRPHHSLNEWVFINSNLQRSRHLVGRFSTVTEAQTSASAPPATIDENTAE